MFYLDTSLTLMSCSCPAWSAGGEQPSGNPGEQKTKAEVDFRVPPTVQGHVVGQLDMKEGTSVWSTRAGFGAANYGAYVDDTTVC